MQCSLQPSAWAGRNSRIWASASTASHASPSALKVPHPSSLSTLISNYYLSTNRFPIMITDRACTQHRTPAPLVITEAHVVMECFLPC